MQVVLPTISPITPTPALRNSSWMFPERRLVLMIKAVRIPRTPETLKAVFPCSERFSMCRFVNISTSKRICCSLPRAKDYIIEASLRSSLWAEGSNCSTKLLSPFCASASHNANHKHCKGFELRQDPVATRVFLLGCSCGIAREAQLCLVSSSRLLLRTLPLHRACRDIQAHHRRIR